MSQCVICGERIPDEYGHVCLKCRCKYGKREDLSPLENENRRLHMLLKLERKDHSATRLKLEKADHDRKRYMKRIRFLDARHEVLRSLYHATKNERDILEVALTSCENSLLRGNAATNTITEEGDYNAK